MSSGRCYRRKMMGRGADGGCGTEEKPCPVSRASSNAAASTATRVGGVTLYAQARKALSERSPFEEPEALARVSTLPVGLAASLFKSSDGRRKHKKLHSDSVKKVPSAQQQAPEAWSLWTETEDYFRPITLADVDLLASKRQLGGFSPDSCLTIPTPPSSPKQELHRGSIPTPTLSASLAESAVAIKEGPDVSSRVEDECMEVEAGKPSHKNEDFEVDASMNWVLGSTRRGLIISERPNKKRKHTGGDAGLRRLMLHPNPVSEGSRICDYCCSGEDKNKENMLLQCNSCKVSVHMKCYGACDAPLDTWNCSWCKQMEKKGSEGACVLCPKKGGALKIARTGGEQNGHSLKFAHLFCSIWAPEVVVDDVETMEPILNAERVQETRKRQVCSICKVKQGACIRCSHGTCQAYFHPICVRDAKLRMEIWGKGKSDDIELFVFCAKHSTLHEESFCEADLKTSMNKVQRIRITCKDREKSNGSEIIGVDVSISEVIQSNELSQETDINDLLMILKKLSDRGKVRLPEVALEMGIPFDLLEPIIVGQTASLSSEWKVKVVRWFENYVHMGGPMRQSLSRAADAGESGALGSVLIKSLPSRRRTKSDVRVLKDHKVVCPAGGDTFIDEDCNGKKTDAPVYDSDYSSKVCEILKKMEEGVSYCSEVSSVVQQPQQCNGDANAGDPSDCADVSGLKRTEPHAGARVHPFIQKKLQKVNHVLSCQEEMTSPMETDLLMKNCSNQSFRSLNNENLSNENINQSDNAESAVIASSPEDEVEGEILYLQNKLLDTVVAIKQGCEKLMHRIVRLLPEELDSLKKRRWDLVAVHQYMRYLKEAKKRGRKEKRHKEYQAVLAAAASATETSSRGSSHRKEKVEGISSPQELPADAGGRRTSTPTSQVKESRLKLAMPKITSERHPDVHEDLCDICGRLETMLSRIFICRGCKVAVHLDCYRRPRSPISSWSCEACEESSSAECGFCGSMTGAFRKTANDQWVHNFCAEWVLQSSFRRGQENPVEGMEAALSDAKKTVSCGVCHQNTGVCIKCSEGDCQVSFHPFCAKRAGMLMIVRNVDGKVHRQAYCEKHGIEQRRKADVRQYTAEELKNIKQIRVELEKARLLCERIIRREKLKRDLVLCSQEILASKRDCIPLSSLVDSSSYAPGVSSESATTSIRSDDVTVDSSVSAKRRARIALTSGKSIPRKSVGLGGGEKSKLRKHPEIFQKEVMMTSDQASMQNRRLPKGFVYVPVDSLSKPESMEALEPRRPDG